MTAEITLPHIQAQAHLVSPSVLTLSDNGEIGVKAVGADNRVAFHAVTIVDADSEGTWIRSEEHTSELQSLMRISYAVFCLKKKKTTRNKSDDNTTWKKKR